MIVVFDALEMLVTGDPVAEIDTAPTNTLGHAW
jgi:hypothetical protein